MSAPLGIVIVLSVILCLIQKIGLLVCYYTTDGEPAFLYFTFITDIHLASF
jgi:hypothetical protein